jgi:hypothetical protein
LNKLKDFCPLYDDSLSFSLSFPTSSVCNSVSVIVSPLLNVLFLYVFGSVFSLYIISAFCCHIPSHLFLIVIQRISIIFRVLRLFFPILPKLCNYSSVLTCPAIFQCTTLSACLSICPHILLFSLYPFYFLLKCVWFIIYVLFLLLYFFILPFLFVSFAINFVHLLFVPIFSCLRYCCVYYFPFLYIYYFSTYFCIFLSL